MSILHRQTIMLMINEITASTNIKDRLLLFKKVYEYIIENKILSLLELNSTKDNLLELYNYHIQTDTNKEWIINAISKLYPKDLKNVFFSLQQGDQY